MKEAAGELNTTIIVVISVGILSAFFFTVLWPIINNNFKKNVDCDKAICDCAKDKRNDKNEFKCYIKDKDGNIVVDDLWCVYKG